jgi:hypothetical protein
MMGLIKWGRFMPEYERIGRDSYRKTYYLPDENGIARKIEKIITKKEFEMEMLVEYYRR